MVTDTVLKVCIREIREVLGDDPVTPRFVETAHRLGYRFIESISRTNLPMPVSSLVGRQREIENVTRALEQHRLVTLTGAGGSGKSRLALEVAHRIGDRFEHGAWWIDLAPLDQDAFVPQAVASALGIRDQPGQEMTSLVARFVASREMLLVVDNCEHLIAAAARLFVTLLRAAPRLRVLATSREAIDVDGECVWSTPALSLPDAQDTPAPEPTSERASDQVSDQAAERSSGGESERALTYEAVPSHKSDRSGMSTVPHARKHDRSDVSTITHAHALHFLAMVRLAEGKAGAERGRPLAEEAVRLARTRTASDPFCLTIALASQGVLLLALGEHEAARGALEESVTRGRAVGDTWAIALPLRNLGIIASRHGDFAAARGFLEDSLRGLRGLGEKWFVSRSIETLAEVLACEGDHVRAATLFGAADNLREAVGAPVLAFYRDDYDRAIASSTQALGAAAFERRWQEGRMLADDAVIAYALGVRPAADSGER
jgi:hypothetical protein